MLSQIIKFIKAFVIIVVVVTGVFAGGWYGRDLIAPKDEAKSTQPFDLSEPEKVEKTPIASVDNQPVGQTALATQVDTPVASPVVTPAATDVEQQAAPVIAATPAPVAAPVVVEPPRPTIAFTPGEAKVGNLYVKAQSAAVKAVSATNSRGEVDVAGTLTFLIQNTGAEPIGIAIAERPVRIQYNDGTELNTNWNSSKISGLSFCLSEVERCKFEKPSPFTQIEPGSSPVSVTVYLQNEVQNASYKSMPLIKTGTLSTRLVVMEGANTKNVSISLTDFPVTNNMPKD